MSRNISKRDKTAIVVFTRNYGWTMGKKLFRLGELVTKMQRYHCNDEEINAASRYPNQLIRLREETI